MGSKSKAGTVLKFKTDGSTRVSWKNVTLFFILIHYTVTFLEGDTVSLSCVELAFGLLDEAFDQFKLLKDIVSL